MTRQLENTQIPHNPDELIAAFQTAQQLNVRSRALMANIQALSEYVTLSTALEVVQPPRFYKATVSPAATAKLLEFARFQAEKKAVEKELARVDTASFLNWSGTAIAIEPSAQSIQLPYHKGVVAAGIIQHVKPASNQLTIVRDLGWLERLKRVDPQIKTLVLIPETLEPIIDISLCDDQATRMKPLVVEHWSPAQS